MKRAQKVQKAQEPVKRTRKRKHEKEMNGEIYFDTHRAAEILGVSRGTVLLWVRTKKIRAYIPSKNAFFKQQWLDDFVNERTQEVV